MGSKCSSVWNRLPTIFLDPWRRRFKLCPMSFTVGISNDVVVLTVSPSFCLSVSLNNSLARSNIRRTAEVGGEGVNLNFCVVHKFPNHFLPSRSHQVRLSLIYFAASPLFLWRSQPPGVAVEIGMGWDLVYENRETLKIVSSVVGWMPVDGGGC